MGWGSAKCSAVPGGVEEGSGETTGEEPESWWRASVETAVALIVGGGLQTAQFHLSLMHLWSHSGTATMKEFLLTRMHTITISNTIQNLLVFPSTFKRKFNPNLH